MFSSDNGAPPASDDVNHKVGANPGWIARNHPFRGWKTLIFEVSGHTRQELDALPMPNQLAHATPDLSRAQLTAGRCESGGLCVDGA